MIKAHIKNGQPLRGYEEFTDVEKGVSGGLYLNLMNNLVFKSRTILPKLQKNFQKTRNTHLLMYRTKSSVF